MIQRRFVALLLLAGSLVFWVGAVATLFSVDAKGTRIYFLPPLQRLAAMGAYIPFVQWVSLLQLGSSIAATVGMLLLTRTRLRCWLPGIAPPGACSLSAF